MSNPTFSANPQTYKRNSEKIFSKDPQKFMEVMVTNRNILKEVKEWMNLDIFRKSYWGYGIRKDGFNSINTIEEQITYTDLMLFVSRFLQKKINYLEIGVSAGKNLLQVCNYLNNSSIFGIDIEEINPLLEEFFEPLQAPIQWEEGTLFIQGNNPYPKEKIPSLRKYVYPRNHNPFTYLSCDKFRESTWEQLKGNKFNFIFSDSYHNPESIKDEMERIKKYSLLDEDEFLFVWDDMHGEMVNTFLEIANDLAEKYNLNSQNIGLVTVHGTYAGTRQIAFLCKLRDFSF